MSDSSTMRSSFVFATCQLGAEPALKKEIAREHPELRFAFSRPGFVTFKWTASPGKEFLEPGFELHSVFARSFGLSLSKLEAKAMSPDKFPEGVVSFARALQSGSKLKLHVWERDRFPVGEEPPTFQPGRLAEIAREAILALPDAKSLFTPVAEATPGDLVLDVIVIEEDLWWLGAHLHSSRHSPFPGGKPELSLPQEAPSRAYLKLEDALLWSNAPLQEDDIAVEIGSAPGGASYALLKRGLKVVGIDPGVMSPTVLAFTGQFEHLAMGVQAVQREDLPSTVEWLLLDMNVEPSVALSAASKLALRLKDSLLGVLLTVKLNQWGYADEIPEMLEHVRSMGMAQVRARQLSTNRQEIFVFGLTRKGVARAQLRRVREPKR